MKTAVLGSSRGLGYCLVEEISLTDSVLAVSRRRAEWSRPSQVQFLATDLASENLGNLFDELKSFAPERMIYVAGGGPYGPFLEKKWSSHEWAFRVGFFTPAQLVHRAPQMPTLRQFVYVGSSVAEENGDLYAASYSASKHAFLGLYRSTVLESDLPLDLRVYSPGYMDTDLLPQGSWPRLQSQKLWSPRQVAQDLIQWSLDPNQEKSHKKLSHFSTNFDWK